jgi:hypothetical protein
VPSAPTLTCIDNYTIAQLVVNEAAAERLL